MTNQVAIVTVAGQGPPGIAAFTTTTANFTMPAVGGNVDIDACVLPLNCTFMNRTKTVTVNGTTAVFVSWPDFKPTTDIVSFLAPTTIGGTVGAVPKAVYTTSPSVGFNVTATAGDTSTYPYVIS